MDGQFGKKKKKSLLTCRVSNPRDLAAESRGGGHPELKASPWEDGDHGCQGSSFSVFSPSLQRQNL